MHIDTPHRPDPTKPSPPRSSPVPAPPSPIAVSFDVFDTMLLRRCTDPLGVYELAFALAPVPASHRRLREVFVQQRIQAEHMARIRARERGRPAEVDITAIYDAFPVTALGLRAADRPALVAAEWQAEQTLCVANPRMVARLRQARTQGARVGFLSDTYWPADRLSALLRGCLPADVTWDFLYASCDHGVGKSRGLFEIYLREQAIPAAAAVHTGDSPKADIRPSRKLGMTAEPFPQATPRLAALFQRESALFDLLCAPLAPANRLDGGARTRRRLAAKALPADATAAMRYGAEVVGPVLDAFDRFLAAEVTARAAACRETGGKLAVAFLARDGSLPHLVQGLTKRLPPAVSTAYLEVNRRVALAASATDPDNLATFFSGARRVTLAHVESLFKTPPKSLVRYFRKQRGGTVAGSVFARDLPGLLSGPQVAAMVRTARAGLLAHLRATLPEFDTLTDLVLVDLGYSGTVQRAMRSALAAEGLEITLHGCYLLTRDEALTEEPDGHSATGFIGSATLLPHAKRALLNNVSLLEQICCAPTGTVSHYLSDGTVVREADTRAPENLALCHDLREGALLCARALAALDGTALDSMALDGTAPENTPQDAPQMAAAWAAAVLSRALMQPTDEEILLFGGLGHDINLGTDRVIPMVDPPATRRLTESQPLVSAFAAASSAMWPAAGFAALSPLHSHLYTLFAAEQAPGDLLGDVETGPVTVRLVQGGTVIPLTVSALRTPHGDIRVRVPLPGGSGVSALALPADALPGRGLVRSLTLSHGADPAQAIADISPREIPIPALQASGLLLDGDLIRQMSAEDGSEASAAGGYLVVPVTELAGPGRVSVVTVTIAPLDGHRPLAISPDEAP